MNSHETVTMPTATAVDSAALRREVVKKYQDVARNPSAGHHFHTGRSLARRLGYPDSIVDPLPDAAIESFAGVANPFSLRIPKPGEQVVDIGSGAGLDSFVAAEHAGRHGAVIGVDMTDDMLEKAKRNASLLDLGNVEFRQGLAEDLPVPTGWADVVLSNGVFNLCADKRAVFAEVDRVLRPGGWLQFADIANGEPVPPEALRQIDLWTG